MRRRDVLASALAVLSSPLSLRAGAAEDLDDSFGEAQDVAIHGYNDEAMEPFVSRDGHMLLFNNRNEPPDKTDLHWAARVDDTNFAYRGRIEGANSGALDGVPSLSASGELFFVSTRSYEASYSTLYRAQFAKGAAADVALVKGVSRGEPGWVNFDLEISADGNTLYFVDSWFGRAGHPQSAELVIAVRDGDRFRRLTESGALLAAVNRGGLNYAACVSTDECELLFTSVAAIAPGAMPAIFRSARAARDQAFGAPKRLAIGGFVEAPALSSDGSLLYFHERRGDHFLIRTARRLRH